MGRGRGCKAARRACVTKPILWRSAAPVTPRTSRPHAFTAPESASRSRASSRSAVDLPLPDVPTSTVVPPAGATKETWSSAGALALG